MGRIILMRHGRTLANAAKIIDTRPPGASLSVIGEYQAQRAGHALRGFDLQAIVCSVAIRAQQTALGVVEGYGKDQAPSIQVLPGLQEVCLGELEGLHSTDAYERYLSVLQQWLAGELHASVPGGECAEEVIQRYREVLDPLAQSARSGGDVLLIGHGAALRLAGFAASNVDVEQVRNTYFENCATVVLEPTGEFGNWNCLEWATPHWVEV